ncbi:MAG: ribokinase [Lachnospiraceae bacterium]|nr:ribokinase [Lachnospiraceae bacterium]MDD3614779.1 ribokinase [Lachnospiraceae bacterium]
MKVLNYGSLNYDYVYQVNHMVKAGETLASSEMNTFCGGKGLNQSIALAKAGVPVYHAGMVGEEGDVLIKELALNNVNTEFVKKIEGKSGHTIIQVDATGQNCILLFGGANQQQTRIYIDEVLSHFDKGDMLLLQNEVNELAYLIDRAYEKKMVIALNPSPFNEKLDNCDLNKISLFFINEIEGQQITHQSRIDEILNGMRKKYPQANVVLTLGSEGCVYQERNIRLCQPIFEVDVVDTTAAGDTFTGYFIASMLENMPPEEGLRMAARASSLAVSRPGAAASIPKRKEIDLS